MLEVRPLLGRDYTLLGTAQMLHRQRVAAGLGPSKTLTHIEKELIATLESHGVYERLSDGSIATNIDRLTLDPPPYRA
jgi:hypothetical protein